MSPAWRVSRASRGSRCSRGARFRRRPGHASRHAAGNGPGPRHGRNRRCAGADHGRRRGCRITGIAARACITAVGALVAFIAPAAFIAVIAVVARAACARRSACATRGAAGIASRLGLWLSGRRSTGRAEGAAASSAPGRDGLEEVGDDIRPPLSRGTACSGSALRPIRALRSAIGPALPRPAGTLRGPAAKRLHEGRHTRCASPIPVHGNAPGPQAHPIRCIRRDMHIHMNPQ